ncbi:MAG: GGDEF domain-containing protein [Rhodospirillales bacterium]|jgi:diguanylate cyclase (GGDEF)-like protein
MTEQMFVPDLRTILVMTIFVFAIQGFFLFQLYRIKRRRAFAILALGCAAFSAGFVCYFLRPYIGLNWLTVPVANLLILVYPVFLLLTLMECYAIPQAYRAVLWALPGIVGLLYVCSVHMQEGLLVVIVASAINGLFYLVVAGFTARYLPMNEPSMRMTLASNLVLAVTLFGRAGVGLVMDMGVAPAAMAPSLAVWLSYTLLIALFCLSTQIYGLPLQEFTRSENTLRHLASVDPLTEVLNRRSFFERAEGLLASRQQDRRPLSVLMLDLDRFKSINDRHGHPTGDRVIIAFARLLREALRHDDLLGRMGGEEFAIILPGAQADQAAEIAERIRAACEAEEVLADDGFRVKLTVSIGLAERDGDCSLEGLLKQADQAMYQAKDLGRNRVVVLAS